MTPNLLILGGTTEATALAQWLVARGIRGQLSLAGRVAHPKAQSLPVRIGGFGGAQGLADFLRAKNITHLVDATHPFAAAMSHNASAASALAGVPLIALSRPAWTPQSGDNWTRVADMAQAVSALNRPARNVFLAIGRMHIAEFAAQPQHHYLLRLVDAPEAEVPIARHQVIVSRGPFNEASDIALLKQGNIAVIVSKNSGGTGAYAKISAARALGLEVIMIDRPALPKRREAGNPQEVWDWIYHSETGASATNRGV